VEKGIESGHVVRTDTTPVAAPMCDPSDSLLLGDAGRVLERLLRRVPDADLKQNSLLRLTRRGNASARTVGYIVQRSGGAARPRKGVFFRARVRPKPIPPEQLGSGFPSTPSEETADCWCYHRPMVHQARA